LKKNWTLGQVSIRRFNDQVIVIVHQAIGMTDPVKTLADLRQRIEKQSPVAVVLKDRFAFVSAGCDMIKRTRRIQFVRVAPCWESTAKAG
jgi:hypothetical protein